MRFNPKKEITEDQKKFLIDNCEKISIENMAKHLHVSVSKVSGWKKELGLIGKRYKSTAPVIEKHEHYFNWSSARKTDFIFNNV